MRPSVTVKISAIFVSQCLPLARNPWNGAPENVPDKVTWVATRSSTANMSWQTMVESGNEA